MLRSPLNFNAGQLKQSLVTGSKNIINIGRESLTCRRSLSSRPHLSKSLVYPRRNYSSHASSGSPRVKWQQPVFIAIGFLCSAMLGYSLAGQASLSSPNWFKNNSGDHEEFVDLSARYGSPQDYRAAIVALRNLFPEEDYVTTDPEDLNDHGFSLNDYHPGKLTAAHYMIHAIDKNFHSQVHCTAS